MIVFGSRGSDLALYQSRRVAAMLAAATGEEVRIEVIETRGDRVLDQPLPLIGGKGLFTAELEQALREGRIDAAVHSMKDLPVQDPEGLTIGAVPERRAPHDVMVYDPAWADDGDADLPLRAGCPVGTSSYRRRAALERRRPDLRFLDIRGNVPTRVDKVRRGEYGAVVLAAAGLDRLELPLDGLLRRELSVAWSTPAPSQGALAVQCRSDDVRVLASLARLHDAAAARCAHAERAVLERLGGGCSMPLGVLVTPDGGAMRLQAAFYSNPEHCASPAGVFVDLRGEDPMAMAAQVADRWLPLVDAPLRGRDVVLLRPELQGLASEHGVDELGAALAVAGARVQRVALTRSTALPAVRLDRAMLAGRTLAFTSAQAVERFCAANADIELQGLPVFAGGPATADAARRRGMLPRTPSATGSGGAALAECIVATGVAEGGVLFPCAVDRHPDLEARLADHGVAVTAVPLYRTEPLPDVELLLPDGAMVVFTSPSAVRAFAARERGAARHVAIGRSTAAAMAAAGLRCDAVADEPTAPGLIRACLEHHDV